MRGPRDHGKAVTVDIGGGVGTSTVDMYSVMNEWQRGAPAVTSASRHFYGFSTHAELCGEKPMCG